MSFPYFISPEQAMRERSELARKGIARGRSVVVLAYSGGVLFVAENPSRQSSQPEKETSTPDFATNAAASTRAGGAPAAARSGAIQ